jgi:hypothetical protein
LDKLAGYAYTHSHCDTHTSTRTITLAEVGDMEAF